MSLYLLVYLLWCALIVWPPAVFSAAGLTLAQLISTPLGSEMDSFVVYQCRRGALTAFVHSALPLGYLLGLLLRDSPPHTDMLLEPAFSWWKLAWTLALIVPIYALVKIAEWYRDNWALHPACKNLAQYCDSNTSLSALITSVNAEYKRLLQFAILLFIGLFSVMYSIDSNM